MENGKWKVGEKTVENGKWVKTMESGKWKMESEKQRG